MQGGNILLCGSEKQTTQNQNPGWHPASVPQCVELIRRDGVKVRFCAGQCYEMAAGTVIRIDGFDFTINPGGFVEFYYDVNLKRWRVRSCANNNCAPQQPTTGQCQGGYCPQPQPPISPCQGGYCPQPQPQYPTSPCQGGFCPQVQPQFQLPSTGGCSGGFCPGN